VLLRAVGAVVIVAFLVIAYTPVPNLIDRHFGVPPRIEPAAAIVVLAAGGVRGDGTLSDSSLRRTMYGIALYRRGLAPVLALSGPPSGTGHIEADVRAAFAREVGVPDSAILTESTARTTREEASRMGALLLPRGVRRILLIVDVEGSYRAARLFERSGFETLVAPAEDVSSLDADPESRLELGRRLAIETVAIVYYRLAGYF
jgi:uncharacterized SAM-binding protein YcdF (DUF218 family)